MSTPLNLTQYPVGTTEEQYGGVDIDGIVTAQGTIAPEDESGFITQGLPYNILIGFEVTTSPHGVPVIVVPPASSVTLTVQASSPVEAIFQINSGGSGGITSTVEDISGTDTFSSSNGIVEVILASASDDYALSALSFTPSTDTVSGGNPGSPNPPPSPLDPEKAEYKDIANQLEGLSLAATGDAILFGGLGKATAVAAKTAITEGAVRAVGIAGLAKLNSPLGETNQAIITVGLDLAAATLDIDNPVALTFDAIGFVSDFTGAIAKQLASDPPDSNFTEVSAPEAIALVLPQEFNKIPDAAILNVTLENMLNFISLSTAVLDAAQRDQGAVLAGDQNSADMQMTAYNEYSPMAENSAGVFSNDLRKLFNDLALPPVSSYENLLGEADLAISNAAKGPLPKGILSDLENATGLGAAQINAAIPAALAEFGIPDPTLDIVGVFDSVEGALAALPPAQAPITMPDAPSVSNVGTSSSNSAFALTNLQTPVLTGTADPGSTVTIYDGVQAVGSAMANSQGLWQVTTSALSVGTHTLTATATDAQGDVSYPSSALTLSVVRSSQVYLSPKETNAEILAGDGNNYIDLHGGNNFVQFGSGHDTVVSGASQDTIDAGAGSTDLLNFGGAAGPSSDLITLSAGARATLFDHSTTKTGPNADTVTGFVQNAGDRIEFAGSGSASKVQDVLAHVTTDTQGNVQIHIANSTITLIGVQQINSSFFA